MSWLILTFWLARKFALAAWDAIRNPGKLSPDDLPENDCERPD
jgi:hypothetical protein